MPKIKICGITRPQEAECLNEAGVEYAGFVFYGKSRRNLSFLKARQIPSDPKHMTPNFVR